MISTCNFAIIESAEFIVFVIDDIPMNDLPTFTARDFNPAYMPVVTFLSQGPRSPGAPKYPRRLFLYIDLRTLPARQSLVVAPAAARAAVDAMLEDLFAEKVPADAGEPVITLDDVCAFLEDSTVRMSELGAGSAAPTTQAYAYDAHGPICMAPAQAAEITNEMLTHASQLPMPPHLPAQLTHPPLTFAPAAALPAAALPAAALRAPAAAFSRASLLT